MVENLSANYLMSRLKGKTAIVTGSTSGIGFATAKRLAAEGANVVVSSRKKENVDAAVKSLKDCGYSVAGAVCHVTKSEDRQRLFQVAIDEFGGIDILVSCVGVNTNIGPVLDCPEDAWDKLFDVNVKAGFMLSKEVVPHLRDRGGGAIVYLSSICAFKPLSFVGAYSVTKTALCGLTKAAAQDLAVDNIRVNCVAPGIIETKFSEGLHRAAQARKMAMFLIPMNRFGEPEDVSGVIAFLCSNDASYITGEVIVAAGGMPSRL